jgi:hypothetical protein
VLNTVQKTKKFSEAGLYQEDSKAGAEAQNKALDAMKKAMN